jgi:Resolvase, N terminal domain
MTTKRRKTARTVAHAKRRLWPAALKVAQTRSSDAGEITSKPMLLGYARVSTVDQNLALQRDALTEAGCAKIFTEQMSGAVTDRPALHDALEFGHAGEPRHRRDPDRALPRRLTGDALSIHPGRAHCEHAGRHLRGPPK